MKRLLIAAVGCVALSPWAALADVNSESHATVSRPDFFPQGSHDTNSTGLTTLAGIVGTQPENLGATANARTGPGTMGVKGSAGPAQRSVARAITGDAWQVMGGPVATPVPMGLHIKFSGTLDPWMVDPALPNALVEMYVSVRYIADVDPDFAGDETQFDFVQAYSPHLPGESGILSAASFTTSGVQDAVDVSQYLVFSGNTVSFDHTFDWSIPMGTWTDSFQAETSINSYPENTISTHSIDFYSTFNAAPISHDPNRLFISDGGQTTTVPEPAGLMVMIPVLAGLRGRRR